ncbi:ATP-binding protein [Streptomyces sp. NPDC059917]|uniref:ATP-binding protein n=1 Tax=Streptomyces sp. NPDC059917 TaxID=3347002 RepID=UPI003651A2A3
METLADDLGLVVAELLTNVLRHAVHPDGTPVGRARCVVQRTPTGLVIVVHDDDPALPREQPADDEACSGRGLRIVRALASGLAIVPSPAASVGTDITLDHEPPQHKHAESAA